MIAVGFGLSAALLWGCSDYLVRLATRRLGVIRAIIWTQLPNLLLMTMVVLLAGDLRQEALTAGPTGWGFAVLSALCALGASVCLARALLTGVLALVSPIVSSYGAVTAALSVMAGQERPAPLTAAGLAVCVLGVALVSASRGRSRTHGPGVHPLSAGTGWALLSSLGFGVSFWIQGAFVVERMGPFAPVWVNVLVGVISVAAFALASGRSLAPPPRAIAPLVVVTGPLGSLAFLAYLAGVQSGRIAVVTVLSSLAAAVTVLLAFVLLRERLAPRQWAGVAAAVAGVVVLNAAR